MCLLVDGLQALVREADDRNLREAVTRRAWCADADPVPVEVTHWPEDSLGDRFFASTHL
jgi:hypothetical protein